MSAGMLDVRVESCHVAVGCNRHVNAASWGPSGLLAFAAHRGVAIADVEQATINCILPLGSDIINCVEWLPKQGHVDPRAPPPADHLLLAGSADGTLHVWSQNKSNGQWAETAKLSSAHGGSITCIASLLLPVATLSSPDPPSNPSFSALVATTSSDCSVRLWNVTSFPKEEVPAASPSSPFSSTSSSSFSSSVRVALHDSLQPSERQMMSAAALSLVEPSSSRFASLSEGLGILLAAGGLDHAIHLFLGQGKHLKFLPVCKLTGHQDWIRSLDFTPAPPPPKANQPAAGSKSGAATSASSDSILLASGSQDRNIRIWKISRAEENVSEQLPGATGAKTQPSFRARLGKYMTGPTFQSGSDTWRVALESLLIGHEDWVQSVRWCPPVALQKKTKSADSRLGEGVEASTSSAQQSRLFQPLRLLSASMDRTMLMWRLDPASQVWLNDVSLGELSHSALGFYGGLWSPRGDAVLAHGYGGSLHLWRRTVRGREGVDSRRLEVGEEQGEEAEEKEEVWGVKGDEGFQWNASVTPSGHFGPVSDISWAPDGDFLLSVSFDQTARIWMPWLGKERSRSFACANGSVSSTSSATSARHGRPSATSAEHGGPFASPMWHEVARPQIHGHDIFCCTFLEGSSRETSGSSGVEGRLGREGEKAGERPGVNGGAIGAVSEEEGSGGAIGEMEEGRARREDGGVAAAGEKGAEGGSLGGGMGRGDSSRGYSYVSGAEEKVLRVFDAPGAFLETLEMALAKPEGEGREGRGSAIGDKDRKMRKSAALGAQMSALGLSQKPIFATMGSASPFLAADSDSLASQLGYSIPDGPFEEPPAALPSAFATPPLEEQLSSSTLWPEQQKLYGHGNELFCCAADHAGRFLATACKAQSAEVAAIWLWQAPDWMPCCQLEVAHSLTVTQMEFSPSDEFLVAVSRDRHVSLFHKPAVADSATGPPYRLCKKWEAHKRIIWAVSWSPCGKMFATESRDKTVKIWNIVSTGAQVQVEQVVSLPPFPLSVTAIAWAPLPSSCNASLVSIGMEDGRIELWGSNLSRHDLNDLKFSLIHKFDSMLCHVSTVQRLRWGRINVGRSERREKIDASSVFHSSYMLRLASCSADNSVRIFGVTFAR